MNTGSGIRFRAGMSALGALVLLAVAASAGAAQEPVTTPEAWMVGGSVGMPGPAGLVCPLGALTDSGVVGTVGVNAGMAALFFAEPSLGVRVGVAAHRLAGVDGTPWLVEVGLVRPRR